MYPKAVWYIFGNEFCERFSFYGLKAILVLFLTTVQKYDNNTSTMIFHMFLVCAYLTPLFGAIIADSYWGKYKTIFILSIVHAIGNILVAVASYITSVTIHFQRIFMVVGLLLTSIGAGGIKPCVSSFGGDQFVLPDQEDHLRRFFSIFYFTINAGSLLSTFISPELRKSVHCFGKDSCFPLAFGVPAVLMLISIVFFISGKRLYKIKKPESSVIVTSVGCMFYALKKKITSSSSVAHKNDWLEYADDKYKKHEIIDLRSALDVLYLFIPLPLFSTLYDQQGSRWILQGTLMQGKIDFLNWHIKPDQVHVINPLFVLIFIPFFDIVVYPILYKFGIKTPLQKITLGGIFAALSFVMAAVMQRIIVGRALDLSANESYLRIYNGFDCKVTVSNPLIGNSSIGPLDVFKFNYKPVLSETDILLFIEVDPVCQIKTSTVKQHVKIVKGRVISYFLTYHNDGLVIELQQLNNLKKLNSGNPNLRILCNEKLFGQNITLRKSNHKLSEISVKLSSEQEQNYEIPVGNYDIYRDHEHISSMVYLLPASVNYIILHHNINDTDINLITVEKGNHIHILWQVPQIILITIAEVMFAITLLEFSFTQAPLSMKSFLTAACLCTTAVGNLLMVIISKMNLFENQVYEYLFFAILMVFDMIVFILMSVKYKYKNVTNNQQ